MSIFDKATNWIEGIQNSFGKFVSQNWGIYWVALSVIAAGGIVGDLLGWPFSLFVPGWFLLVGYVMKKKYNKTQ
jgi:hypothetical protein